MTLIAAVSDSGLIGRANDLPWKISADLKFFKATTLEHVMLMGSNTWQSFGGRCLPRRHHVIVTSKPGHFMVRNNDISSVTIAGSLDTAITCARIHAAHKDQDRFFVIGGGSIYKQTIDQADELILTGVHKAFEPQPGDVLFPDLNQDWKLVSSGPTQETEDGTRFTLDMRYERR